MEKRTKRWSFQGIKLVIHPQHATVEGRVRIHEESQMTAVRVRTQAHLTSWRPSATSEEVGMRAETIWKPS